MGLHRMGRLVALLAIVGLLALALRGPVSASLEEPLVRLWWAVRSIPEQWVWGTLAVLGFIVAFTLGRGSHHERPEPTLVRRPSQTQYERLSELIDLARTSPWARDVLGRRLSDTAAVLRALSEGIHRDDAREEIRTGRWPTEPQMTAVLHPKREGAVSHSESYIDELARALADLEHYAQGATFERN
jgi:hypothetical protein